jgi:diguanylate cyclase (GGDEF)-like protein
MNRSDKSKKDSIPEPASVNARRDRSIDKSLDGITRRKVSRTRWLRAVKRMRQLSTTVNELRAENEALRRLAYQDALTGLINRRGFDEHLGLALAEHAEHSHDLAVILLDVDDLKHINDTRGHAAGDAALRIVADSLRRAVRLGDYVARLGGDEFAVLLPRTNEARARGIAERVRTALHQASSLAGHCVTVSAGVAEVRRDDPVERQAELLLQRADGALYAAKNAGRDRVDTATFCACRR